MDVVIQTRTEQSADFKRELSRFLGDGAVAADEGFTIHWTEPLGDAVLQHLRFDSAAVAEAFQMRWLRDGDGA